MQGIAQVLLPAALWKDAKWVKYARGVSRLSEQVGMGHTLLFAMSIDVNPENVATRMLSFLCPCENRQ